MVKGLSDLSYKDRLRCPSLVSPSCRSIRGDLVLAHRMLKDVLGMNMSRLLLTSRTDHPRVYFRKVEKSRLNSLRLVFHLSNSVVDYWVLST